MQVWYVGAAGLEGTIDARLRALSDPSTPIVTSVAVPVEAELAVDVAVDPRRVAAEVVSDVREALLDEDRGLLAPGRIGIGAALFRSRIFAAVLAVPGALGVRTLDWDGAPFDPYGKSPGAGRWFDLAARLWVTGS